jgi:hypothetical protein
MAWAEELILKVHTLTCITARGLGISLTWKNRGLGFPVSTFGTCVLLFSSYSRCLLLEKAHKRKTRYEYFRVRTIFPLPVWDP